MNLCLSTIDVWTFKNEFSVDSFLRQLRFLLQDGDVIAFGAYNPSSRCCKSFLGVQAEAVDADRIYSTTFDLNRAKYPKGRSFELTVSDETLDALVLEAQRMDSQNDKPLFFDHLVAYRRGIPVVPLLCFHDAFSGGTLTLSGLYLAADVQTFASRLPSEHALQRNPENYPVAT